MERKIGEIFEYQGEWYQCIKDDYLQECISCTFYNKGYFSCEEGSPECVSHKRNDNTNVIFKKLEKVGGPYRYMGKVVQKYKTCCDPVIADSGIVEKCTLETVDIVIKQNQEDMEDNKKQTSLNSTKGIYEKFKGKTVQCLVNNKDGDLVNGYGIVCGYRDKYLIIGFTNEYEGCIKSFTDNVFLENRDFLSYRFWNISHVDDKPFIKPFNLEAARSGKPVCTRDGRKVRIICFDKGKKTNDFFPVVALVETEESGELIINYTNTGHYWPDTRISDNDLVMLLEKKEMWTNVYRERCYETKAEAIQSKLHSLTCVDTIRIEIEE